MNSTSLSSPNFYYVPTRKINITQDIIDTSTPEDYAGCLIATGLRMRLGARSIYVTADFIKFNMPGTDAKGNPLLNPDGSQMMIRYCYPTPKTAGGLAQKFDDVFHAKGVDAARADAKPFHFMLQSEHAFARPVQKRAGEGRGPTRIKRAADAPKVCKRRYHGHTEFSIESSDLTPAERKNAKRK